MKKSDLSRLQKPCQITRTVKQAGYQPCSRETRCYHQKLHSLCTTEALYNRGRTGHAYLAWPWKAAPGQLEDSRQRWAEKVMPWHSTTRSMVSPKKGTPCTASTLLPSQAAILIFYKSVWQRAQSSNQMKPIRILESRISELQSILKSPRFTNSGVSSRHCLYVPTFVSGTPSLFTT